MMAGYQFPEHPEKIEASLVNAVLQAARDLMDNSPLDDNDDPYPSEGPYTEFRALWRALSALDAWADQERKA